MAGSDSPTEPGRSPDTPGVWSCGGAVIPCSTPPANAPGVAVSRGSSLHNRQIDGLVGDDPFQPQVLLLQGLQALGLIHAESAVLLLPPIVGVFGDADRAARLRDDEAFSGFDLHRTQMLDDLFGRVPLLGQVNDLPGCRSRLRFCLNQICPGRSERGSLLTPLAD